MPCCKFWPVDEKQAYVNSTHLNYSDKLSRIMEQIKYNHLLINYPFDLTLFFKGWNVRFLLNFFKALLEHLH